MPPAPSTATVSLVLSAGVIALAAYLALRQWRERRRREPELSAADARHFARQDVRRWVGAVIMVLLALGLSIGSRIKPAVAARATNLWFVRVWLVVCLLILILLGLAMLDWVSTWRYARRHGRTIAQERLEILEEEVLRRLSFPKSGRNGPQNPTDGPLPPD